MNDLSTYPGPVILYLIVASNLTLAEFGAIHPEYIPDIERLLS